MNVNPRPRALDTDLSTFIAQNLPVGTSYETLKALSDALNYVAQGGNRVLNVPFGVPGEVLTNLAAAATLLRASAASAKKIDLTQYTQCRIVAITGGVAGPAGAKVALMFKTTLGANAAAYASIGATAVEAAIETIDTAVASAWIDLATAAKADVFVTVVTSGGDGAIDPVVGTLEAQFR